MASSILSPDRNRARAAPRPSWANESLEALAGAIARRFYGFAPTAVVRLRSESNHVFRVEFGGLPAKVIKLPGRCTGLLREQRVIRALRKSRWALPVPAIEFTQDDLPADWEHEGTSWPRPRAATVMPLCPGMTLADAILRGEPWAGDAMRAAGGFAARLAEVSPGVLGRVRRVQSEQQIRRALAWVRPVIEAFGQSAAVVPAFAAVAEGSQRATAFAHGGFYPQNMLMELAPGGLQLTVLDWETARPSSPLADLGGLLASLVLMPLSDAGQRAYLRRRAIDGFAALRPLSAGDERELRAWETVRLLSAARFELAAGREDDARRLVRAADAINL